MGVVVGTGKSDYEDKLDKQMAGIFLAFSEFLALLGRYNFTNSNKQFRVRII